MHCVGELLRVMVTDSDAAPLEEDEWLADSDPEGESDDEALGEMADDSDDRELRVTEGEARDEPERLGDDELDGERMDEPDADSDEDALREYVPVGLTEGDLEPRALADLELKCDTVTVTLHESVDVKDGRDDTEGEADGELVVLGELDTAADAEEL